MRFNPLSFQVTEWYPFHIQSTFLYLKNKPKPHLCSCKYSLGFLISADNFSPFWYCNFIPTLWVPHLQPFKILTLHILLAYPILQGGKSYSFLVEPFNMQSMPRFHTNVKIVCTCLRCEGLIITNKGSKKSFKQTQKDLYRIYWLLSRAIFSGPQKDLYRIYVLVSRAIFSGA